MGIHKFIGGLSFLRWSLIGLGCLTAGSVGAQTQGVTDTEILVSTVTDLSGPTATYGTRIRDGMIFATEEINAAGGIHGRKIRLLVEDSGFDPKKGVMVTHKLLTQDKVFAVITSYGSAVVQATQPLVIDHGVPFLFPVATSNISSLPFHSLKFGMWTLADESSRTVVEYAYSKLGKRRFGILYQDDEAGQSVYRATVKQLEMHGLSLREVTTYKRGDTDFSSQIARLKAANVDVVVLGTILRETAAAEIEAKAQGWPVDMVVPWAIGQVVPLGGQAVEGLYGAMQFLVGAAQPPTPVFQALAKSYKARFGQDIADGVSYAYTSMMLFAEGAKNAGRNLTPTTLSKGLEKISNFKTGFAAPAVSYSATDHAPPRGSFMVQVRGGKWVPITTEPVTYDDLMK